MELRRHTAARIALGRTGVSMPTHEVLRFGYAHAEARDAVYTPLDEDALREALEGDGWTTVTVHSAAKDRSTYLARPDLGRQLDGPSEEALGKEARGKEARGKEALGKEASSRHEVLLVVGDGLSSAAIHRNVAPFLRAWREHAPANFCQGPVVIARQARVALGDAIGEKLGAKLVAVLIGERPGLSSPDSLGIYLTHDPRPDRTDADRNCISNVRPEGLPHDAAARRMLWLCKEALRLGKTGVELKERSDLLEIEAEAGAGAR